MKFSVQNNNANTESATGFAKNRIMNPPW
jgi:hypothetical protein